MSMEEEVVELKAQLALVDVRLATLEREVLALKGVVAGMDFAPPADRVTPLEERIERLENRVGVKRAVSKCDHCDPRYPGWMLSDENGCLYVCADPSHKDRND